MFCENCGKKILDDSVFCEECGTRIEPDAPPSAQNNTPVPPPPAAPAYNMQQQAPQNAPKPPGYYSGQPGQQQAPQNAPPPPGYYSGQPMPQQAPQNAPPPAGYYGKQPMQQPYSAKKTPVGLIIGIVAAVVVIGVGGFFGIRALSGKGNPAPGAGDSLSVSESVVSPAIPEETPAVSESVVSPVIPEETPAVSESPAIPEETPAVSESPEIPEETPAPENQPQNPYEDYRGYANGNEASIGDFFWFTDDVKWNGLPAGRTVITDFNSIAGYWKAYTEYLRTLLGEAVLDDVESMEWFNAEISGDAGNAVFTYHTKGFTGLEYQGQELKGYDISLREGEHVSGRFYDGQLVTGDVATKGVEIIIKDFYALNGQQYAVGEINYISGEKELIVLVRP